MTAAECRQVFALLSEFIDGELSADLCREIEAHLKACSPCVEFVQSLQKTRDLCRALPPGEPAPPLDRESRERLLAAWQACRSARA